VQQMNELLEQQLLGAANVSCASAHLDRFFSLCRNWMTIAFGALMF